MEDKDFLDISTYIEDLLEFEMLVDESKELEEEINRYFKRR